jgi:hypothetical protein
LDEKERQRDEDRSQHAARAIDLGTEALNGHGDGF